MPTAGMNPEPVKLAGCPSELNCTVQSCAAHTPLDISWGSVGAHEASRRQILGAVPCCVTLDKSLSNQVSLGTHADFGTLKNQTVM